MFVSHRTKESYLSPHLLDLGFMVSLYYLWIGGEGILVSVVNTFCHLSTIALTVYSWLGLRVKSRRLNKLTLLCWQFRLFTGKIIILIICLIVIIWTWPRSVALCLYFYIRLLIIFIFPTTQYFTKLFYLKGKKKALGKISHKAIKNTQHSNILRILQGIYHDWTFRPFSATLQSFTGQGSPLACLSSFLPFHSFPFIPMAQYFASW